MGHIKQAQAVPAQVRPGLSLRAGQAGLARFPGSLDPPWRPSRDGYGTPWLCEPFQGRRSS